MIDVGGRPSRRIHLPVLYEDRQRERRRCLFETLHDRCHLDAAGYPIRYGRDEIVADFGGALETYKVDIDMSPGDTIQITDGWIYGISHVDGVLTEKADGSKSAFKFTVAQLIQKQESGEWLIRRQMWNNKPD